MSRIIQTEAFDRLAVLGPGPSRSEIEALAAEDAPYGDLTTEALGIASLPAVMRFSARDPLVVAGSRVAAALVEANGGAVCRFVDDGERAAPGRLLLEASGTAGALHRAWKQAQTTMEILSGIAAAARELVDAVAATGRVVPVACTRKSFPGARRLAVAAIRAGGCVSHRLGISETVLVFEEHRRFLAGTPLSEMVARLRAVAPEKKLVIEVADVDEAVAAAAAGFDVIQTEKFTPDALARAVAATKAIAPAVVIASAGGITPANVAAHVTAGADVVVTSWPYTARPRDVQVDLRPAEGP